MYPALTSNLFLPMIDLTPKQKIKLPFRSRMVECLVFNSITTKQKLIHLAQETKEKIIPCEIV